QISKAVSPIVAKWQGEWKQAKLAKDKAAREQIESFRSDVISYRNAWQFLSQIVDYDDPMLAKRAVLTTLLARRLHTDGIQIDLSYLDGVQLSGVKLVPAAIAVDYSLSEGSSDGIELPQFDGEHGGGAAAPKRGPLDEAIDAVNEL